MDHGKKNLLVVGLGNPGSEYDGTRHNAGFAVVDLLLEKLSGRMEAFHGYSSHYWKGRYAGNMLMLQKPETFMNLSGDAVAPLMAKYGLAPEDLLVVSDDMDLPLGKLRIRKNGSCGGHNGLRNIMEKLGTENFMRLRIGIGHGKKGSIDHVLSGFEAEEKKLFGSVAAKAAEAAVMILRQGCTPAMNTYNKLDLAEPEEAQEQKEIPTI